MKSIREMIRQAINGGLGDGEAEKAARPTTPDSGHRRVEQLRDGKRETPSQDNGICRVVGFIPFLKA